MGLIPNVKEIMGKMDVRFAELKSILQQILGVLEDIRAELRDR